MGTIFRLISSFIVVTLFLLIIPNYIYKAQSEVITKTFANGNRYEGEFVNGKRNGQGTMTWSSGDRYTGGWDNDKRQGQGTYTWSNGESYTGGWDNDLQTGVGTYTNADGSPFRDDIDGDGDSDFGDFPLFVGTALSVAGAVMDMMDMTSGSGSGGSGGTVYTNPSKGTAYTNPSKGTPFYTNPSKKGYSRSCGAEMVSGGCSCWNRCCIWTWLDDGAGGLTKARCSVK